MTRPLACLVFAVSLLPAQQPSFEAATIKPSKTPKDGSGWHSRPGYVVMDHQTLVGLVAIANRVTKDRVTGGPKWASMEQFDIEARAKGPADDPELMVMLQSLLKERFQIATHNEKKESQGFALTIAKGGLKVKPDASEGGSESHGGRADIAAVRMSLPKLSEHLTRVLGLPVVDETGDHGRYSFKLEWSPESLRPNADGTPANEPTGVSIFTALQSTLGLKLESRKLNVDYIVVDKAEKPGEN